MWKIPLDVSFTVRTPSIRLKVGLINLVISILPINKASITVTGFANFILLFWFRILNTFFFLLFFDVWMDISSMLSHLRPNVKLRLETLYDTSWQVFGQNYDFLFYLSCSWQSRLEQFIMNSSAKACCIPLTYFAWVNYRYMNVIAFPDSVVRICRICVRFRLSSIWPFLSGNVLYKCVRNGRPCEF